MKRLSRCCLSYDKHMPISVGVGPPRNYLKAILDYCIWQVEC